MSQYFMHTDNIYEAINVLGENTTFMGVRLFNKDGKWKYEFEIVNMRKELKLDRHLRATNDDAGEYLFSHIEEVPEPLQKLKEEREFIQDKMNRFGKVMTTLHLKKSKYSKTYLLNFVKDFFPELTIAKNTKVPNIIKRIINAEIDAKIDTEDLKDAKKALKEKGEIPYEEVKKKLKK